MKRILISLMALTLMMLMCAGLALPVYAVGTAPVAENLELCTYRNVSVGGMLSAYDPDGSIAGYEISTDPVKGLLELGTDGSFTYTPGENKKGKDYFGYRAVDNDGNYSQEATVIIKIQKQKKSVAYGDMDGLAGEYYAVALSENDIYTGEQICGEYCFNPDEAMSRGEYISMCMKVCGEPLLSGVMNSGYGDDASIPTWMKSYVATAAMSGIDQGMSYGEEKVFNAEAPIGLSEAMAILNKALKLNDVSYISLDDSLELDMAQACANLSASGILREGTVLKDELSRLEAAELLVRAMELVNNR